MASCIEVTTAVSSTQCLFQFKVCLNGQALTTESDTKPNFHRFSVSWDLAVKLLWPILAAATSTLHSTICWKLTCASWTNKCFYSQPSQWSTHLYCVSTTNNHHLPQPLFDHPQSAWHTPATPAIIRWRCDTTSPVTATRQAPAQLQWWHGTSTVVVNDFSVII